jgi:hypothetical protein
MMDTGSGKQKKKEAAVASQLGDDASKKEAGPKVLQCGLRVLGIAGCGITDNGIADLGGSLRTNKVLGTLDVRCNELTDDGIVALARSLEENTQLRELYVRAKRAQRKGQAEKLGASEASATKECPSAAEAGCVARGLEGARARRRSVLRQSGT